MAKIPSEQTWETQLLAGGHDWDIYDYDTGRSIGLVRGGENEATVVLMAAAPKLLRSLKNLLAEVNRLGWGDSLETKDADNAIAQAEGY